MGYRHDSKSRGIDKSELKKDQSEGWLSSSCCRFHHPPRVVYAEEDSDDEGRPARSKYTTPDEDLEQIKKVCSPIPIGLQAGLAACPSGRPLFDVALTSCAKPIHVTLENFGIPISDPFDPLEYERFVLKSLPL